MDMSKYGVGPIQVKGAVTVDFGLPGVLPVGELPSVIERDRMHMAKRPGLRSKHLPLRIDQKTGNYLSGGRYLFDTVENANGYKSWAGNDFILDGTKFFERPFFIDPVAYAWEVIGAHDFADMQTEHSVIRSERWRVSSGKSQTLATYWPQILNEAEKRSLASIWLLNDEPDQVVGIVTIASHTPNASEVPDAAALEAIGSSPTLGLMFDQAGYAKEFDRTSWVLSIWFPIAEGQPDVPALWPNSPPFPAPPYAQAPK